MVDSNDDNRFHGLDLPTVMKDPRGYLYNYYTDIGHTEAVEDLVALLPDSIARQQATTLAIQDWAAANLSDDQYEEVVALLGIMYEGH